MLQPNCASYPISCPIVLPDPSRKGTVKLGGGERECQRRCNRIVQESIWGARRACSVNYGKMLAIYIHLLQTLICHPAISSVAAAVAGPVPPPLAVSYLLLLPSHI